MSRDEVRACADDEDEMRKDEVTSTYGYGVRSTEYGLGASGLWGRLRFLQCSATYEVLSNLRSTKYLRYSSQKVKK